MRLAYDSLMKTTGSSPYSAPNHSAFSHRISLAIFKFLTSSLSFIKTANDSVSPFRKADLFCTQKF